MGSWKNSSVQYDLHSFEAIINGNHEDLERTPANRTLWGLACQLGRELGLELQEALAGGGSDGNFTSQYTATLDGMGAVGDGAHARHEHLRIEASLERAALLTLLMMAPPLDDAPAVETAA